MKIHNTTPEKWIIETLTKEANKQIFETNNRSLPLNNRLISQIEMVIQNLLRKFYLVRYDKHCDDREKGLMPYGLRDIPEGLEGIKLQLDKNDRSSIVADEWRVTDGSEAELRKWFKQKDEEHKEQQRRDKKAREVFERGANKREAEILKLDPDVLYYMIQKLETYNGKCTFENALSKFPESEAYKVWKANQ